MALKIAVASFFGVAIVSKIPYVTKHGAPWVPTENRNFELLEEFLEKNDVKRRKFLDLGSGDGRLLRWASKYFDLSFGIEMNPLFYYVGKLRCMGKENVDMKKHDFFEHNFNDSDFIYCFGIDFIMERLLNKCKEEMHDDAFICLYGFGFPGVRPYLLAGQSQEPYRPDMPVDKFPNALIFYRKQDLFEVMDREDLKFQRL